jgi:hypothetical protein
VTEVVVRRPGYRVFTRSKATNALERGEHGTTACYAQRCRCQLCRRAARAAERLRRAELALLDGREPRYRCSAAPLRRHVAALRASGWSTAAVARAAGLNVLALQRLVADPRRRTFSDVVARVLAVG